MQHMTVTEEQLQILATTSGSIELRDSEGRPIGRVNIFSPEDLETIARSQEAQQRGGPRVTSANVQAHLQKLEAISQHQELNETQVLLLLRQMRAEDNQ